MDVSCEFLGLFSSLMVFFARLERILVLVVRRIG